MAVNAIDFSDLTKKPKPQRQDFKLHHHQPQQNQQMGVKKPDGTVEPDMGYPVNQWVKVMSYYSYFQYLY